MAHNLFTCLCGVIDGPQSIYGLACVKLLNSVHFITENVDVLPHLQQTDLYARTSHFMH